MPLLRNTSKRHLQDTNSDVSETFPISNGVKQECALAPTLFSFFFSLMLKQALEDFDVEDAIYVRYRLDGNLFNLRRLQASKKTREELITNLLFADDAALVTHTESAMQRLTSYFADGVQTFGLVISLKKTEVFYQPAPRVAHNTPHININDTELKPVNHFCYLGSTISSDAKIDREIANRLAKARAVEEHSKSDT